MAGATEEVKIVLTAEERASREIDRLQSKLSQFQKRMKAAFSTPISNGFFDDKKISKAFATYGKGMREVTEGHIRWAHDQRRLGKLNEELWDRQTRKIQGYLSARGTVRKADQAAFVEEMQRARAIQAVWGRQHEVYLQQKRREQQYVDQVERAKERLAGLGYVAETRRRANIDALDRQRSRAFIKSEADKERATQSLQRQRSRAYLAQIREEERAGNRAAAEKLRAELRSQREQESARRSLERQRSQAYAAEERRKQRLKDASWALQMRQDNQARREAERADQAHQRNLRQNISRGVGGARGAVGDVRSAATTTAVLGAATGVVVERLMERGFNSRMRIESAEANLRMFGNFSQDKVNETRRGWLDRTAVEKGFSPSSALNAFTEVIKAGIPEASAKAVTQSIMGASAGLDLNVADTTKLVGRLSTLTQNPNSFDGGAIDKMLNGIAVVAKVTAADSNEIVSSLRRGAGVLGSTKMSVQDLTAFTGVGISAGMQEGKAGTFMDFLTNDLVNAKNSRGQRRADLQKGLQLSGLGSLNTVSRQAANDPTTLLLKLFEKMAKMDPQKAGQVASLIGMREWRGEMLMMAKAAPMLRQTVNAERDPANATHLQDAQTIQLGTLRGMLRQINATAELLWEAVGTGLEGPFREVGTFFLNWGKDFNPKLITDHISVLIEGFTTGLGFSSIPEILEAIFGKPGDFNSNTLGKWMVFGKGLGEGIRSVIDSLRAMIPAGGFDPKQLGVWSGEILGFATALTSLGPAISIIGSLGSALLGLGTAIIGGTSAWALLRVLAGAGAGAAGAGAAAGGAGAAAAAGGAGLLAAGFVLPVTIVGVAAAVAYMFGGSKGLGYLGQAFTGGQTKSEQNDFLRKSAPYIQEQLRLREQQRNGGATLQRQSYADPETTGSIGSMIHKASYRAFDDADRGVNRIADSVKDLRSMIQLTALTGGGSAAAITSSMGGGGGGGGSVGGGGGAGSFFTPDGMQVPGWYGKGRGAPGGGSAGPAKFGMGGQTFGQKAPGIMKNLMSDFGLSKEQAAGIVANLGHESAGFTAYQEKNPLGGGRGGAGWAQWTGPRRKQFEAWAKANNLDPRSDEASYGFLKHELNGSEAGALAAVRNQRSAGGAMVAFENQFERAGVKNWGSRQKYLNQAMGLDPNSATPNAAADPAGAATSGAGGNAVDIAERYLGQNEHRDRASLSKFVGHDVAGNLNAWCARFVNASLRDAGVKGSGSAMANSFLAWGKKVDADAVQKGDVAVEHRNKGVNAGGGHVGLATGRKRINPKTGELEIETVSGNHGDEVVKDWTAASKLAIRRSTDAAANAVVADQKDIAAKARRAEGGDPGFKSDGWKPAGWSKTNGGPWTNDVTGAEASPEQAAKLAEKEQAFQERKKRFMGGGGRPEPGFTGTPFGAKPSTDEIVNNVPPGIGGRGGGGGGSRGGGNTYHITQQIHGGANSPTEIANLAQRKIAEDWNHRAHDVEPEMA